MKITTVKPVTATLVESHEVNIPHSGLKCAAKYRVDGLDGFEYTVEFYNKHAPTHINADIVCVDVSGPLCEPMIYINKNGAPMLDKDFNVICTRQLVFLCPVRSRNDESIYYMGHDPLTTANRFVSRYLKPCKFGISFIDFAKKV